MTNWMPHTTRHAASILPVWQSLFLFWHFHLANCVCVPVCVCEREMEEEDKDNCKSECEPGAFPAVRCNDLSQQQQQQEQKQWQQKGRRVEERGGRIKERGRREERRRKDAAATADLNKIGMTITHVGRKHSLSVLPLIHTHPHTHTYIQKAYPTSFDHHPCAPHCSLCSDWLMQNEGWS